MNENNEASLVDELAQMLCDMRWGDGAWKAGGPKLNRSYWRRLARKMRGKK